MVHTALCRTYDVVKIFKTAAALTSRINFRFQFGSAHVLRRLGSLSVRNFVKTHLKPRLSYNYFWFGKTNGHHIEILLPVSTLTYQSSSASHFDSSHHISYESDRLGPSYDVMSFFKMADVSHVAFFVRQWTTHDMSLMV